MLVCLIVLLVSVVFSVSLVAAENGKIRGKVVDIQNGEILIGANVVVVGTTWGGTTDVEGTYIVLNVPAGTYQLKSSMLGYQSVTISNVVVNSNLTTEVNFKLPSDAITVPTVEIVREQPLVNKSATNTVSIVTADALRQMPLRGVAQAFALSTGVVQQGGNYYVRGGRAEETAFYVDGVLVNNPMNGQLTLNIISNAIEEVQSQIGGMTAEYGNGMSGIVMSSSRIGSTKYQASLEVITDELGGATSKNIFGAYSYGLNEYVLTLAGPLIPGDNAFRFFLAGQRQFNRSNPTFMDGIHFPLTFDSTSITGAEFSVTNRDSIGGVTTLGAGSTGNRGIISNLLNQSTYDGGRTVGGVANDSWGLSGNVFADLGEINIKIGGSYSTNTVLNSYGQDINVVRLTGGAPRGLKTVTQDMMAYLKLTHVLSPKSFYSLNLSYYNYSNESGDQLWFDNLESYGNPNLAGNEALIGPSRNRPAFGIYSFSANWPGFVSQAYNKSNRSNLGARLDFTSQAASNWEMKVGGELTYYTIRTYAVNARDLYRNRMLVNDPALKMPVFENNDFFGLNAHGRDSVQQKYEALISEWSLYNQSRVSFYGYDIYGKEFNGGTMNFVVQPYRIRDTSGNILNVSQHNGSIQLDKEGARHPIFAAAYFQNKFEFDDLIMNLGIRFDYLNPGGKQYKNLNSIQLEPLYGVQVVADSSYTDAEISTQLSPRLGFSFPITDRTVFHATYGKFMQYGRLSDLYDSRQNAGYFFAGGYARQYPNPNLKPERTTQYEVGFRQQMGDLASVDLTFYYKDIKDLHVIRVFFPEPGSDVSAYFANTNGDFGTSKGFSLSMDLRRTNRVSARASYTFSSSTATGSTSGSHFDIAWQDNSYNGRPYFPVIPSPTEFDRTHIGNFNIDYRFDKDDGPTLFDMKPLERVGLNLLFSFSSGIRYTRSQVDGAFAFSATNAPQAFEGLNTSAGPWIYQLDLRLDKTLRLFDEVDLNVYLWVMNVLNTKNVIGIYSGTGVPENDGWLTTTDGKQWAETNGTNAVNLYNYLQNAPGQYDTPRVVRLGIQLTY
jgi:outer membrane receptor protein involved in Fe transport